MKRSFTFFILALIATIIAGDDESQLEQIAKEFKTTVPKLKACLDEEEVKIEQLSTWFQTFNWNGTEQKNEGAKEETKRSCGFIACVLEKERMMEDEKLAVDKMIESIKEDSREGVPSEDILTNWKKCMNLLNENQLTREDRACGLIQCFYGH
ncbi:PREDICTED: uncharacterized protein LOC105147424 [Acromyrmex echinatior]|uniref:uncharacterized protein LOC105147424 n=1 Tax=Acromyrmex echinatior TaxID=103372 RepID=UPI000580DE9C|nr:PREDICTED: uncharacterized protein LOC105147424 [Acromyrmex echinatior]